MPFHRRWHHVQFYKHIPTSAKTSDEDHETYARPLISKASHEIQLIYHFHINSMFIFHAATQTSNRAIQVLRSIYEEKNYFI